MDLLEQTREVCRVNKIYPSRSKGQNFLIETDVYEKVVAAADLKKSDVVLEVGPGLGFLTARLAAKAGQVIAIELDDVLAKYLREEIFTDKIGNVEIVNENILDVQIPELFSKFKIQNSKFRIVANLPYNITSVFIRKFLTAENKPEEMVLMLQKEVAERICAKPGDMSLLALGVQYFAEPEIVGYVPKENFWPMPKVGSAIIKIKVKGNVPLLAKEGLGVVNTDEKAFFRLAKFGFSAKRKMLKNNLAGGLHITTAEVEKVLIKIGLNPKTRAEELAIEDWKKLVLEFK